MANDRPDQKIGEEQKAARPQWQAPGVKELREKGTLGGTIKTSAEGSHYAATKHGTKS